MDCLHVANKRRGISGTVLRMDTRSLGFRDATFDSASMIEVLEHVDEPEKALREIARVLKPGGLLFISVPYRGFPFETHGVRFGGSIRGLRGIGVPIPFLTYMPLRLRQKFATAHVYGRTELQTKLDGAGFELSLVRFLLPALDDLEGYRDFGAPIAFLVDKIGKLTQLLERVYGERFGSTIVVVARRKLA